MEHSGETASVGALRSAPTLYPAIRDNNIVNNMVVCPIYTEYYSEPQRSNVPPTLTVTLYVEPFDTDAEPSDAVDDNTNPIGISG